MPLNPSYCNINKTKSKSFHTTAQMVGDRVRSAEAIWGRIRARMRHQSYIDLKLVKDIDVEPVIKICIRGVVLLKELEKIILDVLYRRLGKKG